MELSSKHEKSAVLPMTKLANMCKILQKQVCCIGFLVLSGFGLVFHDFRIKISTEGVSQHKVVIWAKALPTF